MTNLIAEISIALICVTNWTGKMVGTNELGYVSTNHVATIRYDGVDRTIELKSVPSNLAVWRPMEVINWPSVETNIYYWPSPGLVITNLLLDGNLKLEGQ